MVLSVFSEQSGKLQYELLFDDETTSTVDASNCWAHQQSQQRCFVYRSGSGRRAFRPKRVSSHALQNLMSSAFKFFHSSTR